jgi:hypothetical protein
MSARMQGHNRVVRQSEPPPSLTVPCPVCLARVGERCSGATGTPRDPHVARVVKGAGKP